MKRMIAVVGPSGAGKDTLIELALAARPDLRMARRVITRPRDAGGEDFDGVSEAEFSQRQMQGEFALHWRAHGLGYAIPLSALEGEGDLLVNLSRAILLQAQQLYPGLVVILVTAPTEILAARLAGRGREDAADQAARLARAEFAVPAGLDLREVVNDGAASEGCARFLAALEGAPVNQ